MTDSPASVPAPAEPQRLALGLVVASLIVVAPALGFVARYADGYFAVRHGRSAIEQRLTMLGPSPFKRNFLEFCEAVRQVVPEGERILVEPHRVRTTEGRARWFLYMNLELHPRQVYVRKPEWASGTLVDYPRWLQEAVRPLGVVEQIEMDESIDALGIGWRIRYAVALQFRRGSAWLERRVDGSWERVELPEVRFAYGKVLDLGGEASELGNEVESEADGIDSEGPIEGAANDPSGAEDSEDN